MTLDYQDLVNKQQEISGEAGHREQAVSVHPVERGLQGGVPEDQEQKREILRTSWNSYRISQGREEGEGVQFQREIHLWAL